MIAVAAADQMFTFGAKRASAAAVGALDLAGRLAVPATVIALLHGINDAALLCAAAVTVLAMARGVAAGFAGERAAQTLWLEIIDASSRYGIVDLRSRASDRSVWNITAACHQVADLQANVVPRLFADGAGVLIVAIAVGMRLGLPWLLLGGGCFAALALCVMPLRRRFRDAEQRAHQALSELGLDLDVLLDGPEELRAHARAAGFAREMAKRVKAMAAAQRRANTYSALLTLLPLGVALIVAARRGPLFEAETAALAEAGVLATAGLVFSIGLLRSVESFARIAPQRELLQAFLDDAGPARVARTTDTRSWRGIIELRALSFAYAGSNVATPGELHYRWGGEHGLAITGENGSGKSTLALMVMGLLQPTTGKVLVDDRSLATLDVNRMHERIVYVPQNAYVSPTRSVRWHLQLVGGEVPDGALQDALLAVGLGDARRSPGELLDIHAGELSGGERRRLHLARAFLPHEAELIVLDEPEAGIDQGGRAMLRELIAQLAQRARVLLIAQDLSIVPDTFQSLECIRSKVA